MSKAYHHPSKVVSDVLQKVESRGIKLVKPSEKVSKVLELDASKLSSLDPDTINEYMWLLTQYITFLRQEQNIAQIEYDYWDGLYNEQLLSRAREFNKGTLTEKKSWAADLPEMQELKKKLDEAKNYRQMLSGLPDHYTEMLQVLKRVHYNVVDERRRTY